MGGLSTNVLMFIPVLVTLAGYVLAIYFIVSVLRFMKRKTELDEERNHILSKLLILSIMPESADKETDSQP